MARRSLVLIVFFCVILAAVFYLFNGAQQGAHQLLATINSFPDTQEVCDDSLADGDCPVTLEKPTIYLDATRDWELTETNKSIFSDLIAVNSAYLTQLLYTLLNAAIASALTLLFVYFLSFLTDYLRVKGFHRISNSIITPFDLLPYILWIFPFLILARFVFELEPFWEDEGTWDLFISITHQIIIYAGFCMFLVPFFLNEVSQRLKEYSSILESERLLGLPFVSIYFRIFRLLLLRKLYIRQLSYCCLFVMLLDFAFLNFHNLNQADSDPTVFRSAGQHYEDLRKSQKILEGNPTYQELINGLSVKDNISFDNTYDDKKIFFHPQIIDLGNLIMTDNGLQNDVRQIAQLQSDDLKNYLVPREIELQANFSERMYQFYLRMNACCILLLFFVIFFVFDRKAIFHDR